MERGLCATFDSYKTNIIFLFLKIMGDQEVFKTGKSKTEVCIPMIHLAEKEIPDANLLAELDQLCFEVLPPEEPEQKTQFAERDIASEETQS